MKKENLIVLGMISLCIALALETLGNNNTILNIIIIIFIGISIFSNAQYLVVNSIDKKSRKSK
ncbi:MAG: hypothetical protein ACFFFB_11005 [Candidatus Heimdallarchaeota archaeon]